MPLFLQSASATAAQAAVLSIMSGYRRPGPGPHVCEPAPAHADSPLTPLAPALSTAGLSVCYGVVPADTLALLAAHGPLVAAARRQPDEPEGLLVLWRQSGPLTHGLDTRAGRVWLSARRLEQALEVQTYHETAAAWRARAAADAWLYQARLMRLVADETVAERLVARALDEPGWRGLAALDAALRLVGRLVAAGAIERGDEAQTLLGRLVDQTLDGPADQPGPIPLGCWSVRPVPEQPEPTLVCAGVAVARVGAPAQVPAIGQPARRLPRLPAVLALCCEQPGRLGLLGAGLGIAAAGVVAQALILRGLLVLGQFLPAVGERAVALGLLLGFVLALLLLEAALAALLGGMGRRLDARLRMAVMTLLPRLGSQTFQRLSSADLMERIHTVRDLHNLPDLSGQIGRIFFQLLFTLLGLALISPPGAALGLLNIILVAGLVLAGAQVASAQHRRLRAALGDLSRLALDGMLGSVAIHAHLAGAALRCEHERLLARWTRQAQALANTEVWTAALGTLVSTLLVTLAVLRCGLGTAAAQLPLLLFWSLQLGTLSEQLARLGFLYVGELSKGERYLALTNLPSDATTGGPASDAAPAAPQPGAAVTFDRVAVEHDGTSILRSLQLHIAPGSHVAIVGASGAGKSTLVGLLLGRFRPAHGTVLIDGRALDGPALQALREQTAWVDPAVQLWNRPFLHNITYGSDLPAPHSALDAVVGPLLEQLPSGMQSGLGERGRLVSGGQGQRVRYGRAVQRQAARLVILDEPFRGLDRGQRRALLEHARACWPQATLLCVTHDIAHTSDFERVLVVADGQVLEDGCPARLAAQPDSRYAALLAADQALEAQIWASSAVPWRRISLEAGRLEAGAPTCAARPDPPPAAAAVSSVAAPSGGLCWPEPRLPELLAQLARLGFGGYDLPEPADSAHPAAGPGWAEQIGNLVGQLGLEAAPFSLRADRPERLLQQGGPALLQLDDGGWIGVLASGRWWARVLRADGRPRWITTARLRASLDTPQQRAAQAAVADTLAGLGLDEQQRHSAAHLFLHEQREALPQVRGWSLRLEAAAPLWSQVRQARLPQAMLLAALCEALLSALYVLGLIGAGLLAARGQIVWPWLLGIALCVLGRAPLELLKQRYHLALSLRLRVLLKRRLQAGALRLMPGDLQQYGIGQFLSWLMEAERLESLAGVGPLLVNSLVALLICAALLGGGAAGHLLAPLLLGWLGVTALLSWRAYRAYLAQRGCHIQSSRDTLERLDGHQTRLAQEHPARWHDDEDAALERYLKLSRRDDAHRSLLATVVPYGWLLLALAALAPTLIAWPASALGLGVSLLGIAWAFQLLRTLAPAILELERAVGAWQLLAPIEQAAQQPRQARAAAAPLSPQTDQRPLLEARNLSFGYLGQRQPLLDHCDLAIYHGERLLLTGPSGGGKSTLAALLARLRPVQSGLLLLNGLDQHTLSSACWRRQVVMVAQFHENHLFSASLAFNLLMGRQWPPREADLREAEQICHELGLADLLRRMPAGLAQPVGEGGWQLSHGERSRLFVARALLQQAALLILDESLSAVDAASLRATVSCVLARAPTLILIAHP